MNIGASKTFAKCNFFHLCVEEEKKFQLWQRLALIKVLIWFFKASVTGICPNDVDIEKSGCKNSSKVALLLMSPTLNFDKKTKKAKKIKKTKVKHKKERKKSL